ncbi:MAG: hypothetical protein QNI99_17985 [Woeseiaceae bacterium]|nr:hypothetical protein [Woeseiaceae bacterium]
MKYFRTLCLALLVLTAGCSTTTNLSDQMAGWQGQSVTEALHVWGEPEAEEAFGEQTVLIWRDRGWTLLPEAAEARVDSPAVVCERMLAVTDSGEITGWRWRGDACLALHAEPGISSSSLMGHARP